MERDRHGKNFKEYGLRKLLEDEGRKAEGALL